MRVVSRQMALEKHQWINRRYSMPITRTGLALWWRIPSGKVALLFIGIKINLISCCKILELGCMRSGIILEDLAAVVAVANGLLKWIVQTRSTYCPATRRKHVANQPVCAVRDTPVPTSTMQRTDEDHQPLSSIGWLPIDGLLVANICCCRSTPCPNAKHSDEWVDADCCEHGEECAYCHSRTEQQFHPEIYKSTKCNDMLQHGYCPRGPFCAFAHNDSSFWLHHHFVRVIMICSKNNSRMT